jgi:hypothetical protein
LHYLDFYDSSNIFVTGNVSGGGSPPAKFTGEPLIDVTGKARTVLKRLQARVLVNNGNNSPNDNSILPNNALESQNLCKRIQAAPPANDYIAIGSTYDGLSTACNLGL